MKLYVQERYVWIFMFNLLTE